MTVIHMSMKSAPSPMAIAVSAVLANSRDTEDLGEFVARGIREYGPEFVDELVVSLAELAGVLASSLARTEATTTESLLSGLAVISEALDS